MARDDCRSKKHRAGAPRRGAAPALGDQPADCRHRRGAFCRSHRAIRPRRVYKAYFVVTVALCIATAKMFAFYPTLIDLGALAALTAATYVVLTRDGWAGGAAALIAVFARELGIALAFFGMHRDLRRGHGVLRSLLTYAPAVIAMLLIRQWASATNLGDRDRALQTAGDFVANLALWRDPGFVAFFFYFLLTLIGGPGLVSRLRVENRQCDAGVLVDVAASVDHDGGRCGDAGDHSVDVCPVTTATTFLFTVEPVRRTTFTIRAGLR